MSVTICVFIKRKVFFLFLWLTVVVLVKIDGEKSEAFEQICSIVTSVVNDEPADETDVRTLYLN